MLSHLSSKFTLGPEEQTHEPRAALFLNRFTRTMTIMYATSGIEQIVGIPSDQMMGRSFYFCIAQNCLQDAIRCLESAKGNESIAYLRFVFRDPRQDDPSEPATSESEDDIMTDVTASESESETGEAVGHSTSGGESSNSMGASSEDHPANPRTASNNGAHVSNQGSGPRSSGSSLPPASPYSEPRDEPIELEAVVSCTSDGLVVCLRRARPMAPTAQLPSTQPPQYQSIFAAPWAPQPMFAPPLPQQPPFPLGAQHPAMAQAGPTPAFQSAFMQSIRDVAVFAWALVGINGSLADYSRGQPVGESQPPDGFPVWDPYPGDKPSVPPSGYASASASSSGSDPYGFGDPGLR